MKKVYFLIILNPLFITLHAQNLLGILASVSIDDSQSLKPHNTNGELIDPYPVIKSNNIFQLVITSPANNSTFISGNNIVIDASVSGLVSGIRNVEFFQGTVKLGEDITSPYSFTWLSVASGTYLLNAKVTDSIGNTAISSNVYINVNPYFKELNFAAVGDFGLAGSNEASVSTLIKSWNPDFVLSLGDNNYPDGLSTTIDANIGQYYHTYINPYTGLYGAGADTNKFYPCLGNHDYSSINNYGAPYYQYFSLPGNERYYDFIKGPIHFFVLNSNLTEPNGKDSSSIQGQWLKNKLSTSISKWKIVYFHHSPYCSDGIHTNETWMRWPFKKWGADAVLGGHGHVYERLSVDGTPYFVNGLGGGSISNFTQGPLPETQVRYSENFGAMKIKATYDTIDFKFYTISSSLIDSYLLIKSNVFRASITNPQNNSSFWEGDSILIQASVAASKFPIKKVDFFAGTVKLGSDSIYPYSYNWKNVVAGTYSLTANAIDSIGNNALSSEVSVKVNPKSLCVNVGYIMKENWFDISGSTVADIPINTASSSITQLSNLEIPSNVADNYGTRIRGYICPPLTGNYTFWISSDNNSELWLSSNNNPENKQKIAYVIGWTYPREWTKFPSQVSLPVFLTSGNQYYIEILHKEGSGGDNLAVGWQWPDGKLERPIPGIHFSPFNLIQPALSVAVSSPINNSTFSIGTPITINATVTGATGGIRKVDFFSGAVKLGTDSIYPYSFSWTNAPLGNYSLTAFVTDSSNNSVSSAPVNISVVNSDKIDLISAGSTWKYLDNGTNQGTAWRASGFNDSGWKTGNAELGYGDGGEATVVSYGSSSTNKYITTYFRKIVNIADASSVTGLDLSIIRDDGAVIYINGTEVYRTNMPTGTITNTTLASKAINSFNESTYILQRIGTSALVNNMNVIAVEIHQSAPNSSDISFNFKLIGSISTTTPCTAPTALFANSITSSSAILNWTSVPGASSYEIQYRKTGTTSWSTVSSNTNSKSILGLSPGSIYEFQVGAICSTLTGVYSAIMTFTTLVSSGLDLISVNSSWKYLDNGTNQGTAWRMTSFADSTWKTGNAELGYGDGGEATIVSYGPSSTNKYITTYFRKTFNVTDISTISGLELSLIRDDGAVVYINGNEVYRNNLPSGTIYYNTLAPSYIDGANESTFVIASISSSTLVNGTNLIAVEIHQNAVTSSDISFNLKLKTLSGSKIIGNIVTDDSLYQQNVVFENTYEMIVYPNPATGQFNLEFCMDDVQEKTVIIEVSNSFGKVIYNKLPQKINGCIKETIDLEPELPIGVYLMKVTIGDKIQTAKMLLAR